MRKFFLFFVMLFTAVAMNAQTQQLYLKISSDWKYPSKYAIYYFDATTNGWSDFMTEVENEHDIYTATIPTGYSTIIFVRFNSTKASTGNWNDKWSQTVNLTLEEGKDLFTITSGGTGNECNGTWSLFEPTPACDWANLSWISGSNNKLKICLGNPAPSVVGVQNPHWTTKTEDGIYMTFPAAAWGDISLPESKYEKQGAGILLFVSAFELKYTDVSIVESNVEYNFTVYNADGPEVIYTVAGSSEVAFGTSWGETNRDNDMVLEEGLYKWEKTELTLAAGAINFKVVKNHSWEEGAWPASDYVLNVAESGIYTISITFNESTKEINASATKTGAAVVLPVVTLHGNFSGEWADSEAFAEATDKKSASLTMTLAVGNYEFGVKKDGTWTANGAAFTRESPSAVVESGSNNLTLNADKAGDYTFTWTFASNTLDVDYPGCHWNELSWLNSSDATYANQFKVCVGDPAPGVDIIQEPGFASEIGIYMTFPSAVWDKSKFSLTESQYAIQGAGMVIYLSAFSAKETEVTIGCDNKLFEFAVYNAKGTTPSTAIDNTNVAEKAQKFVENGQLFIRRDGKIYTTTGVQVK